MFLVGLHFPSLPLSLVRVSMMEGKINDSIHFLNEISSLPSNEKLSQIDFILQIQILTFTRRIESCSECNLHDNLLHFRYLVEVYILSDSVYKILLTAFLV